MKARYWRIGGVIVVGGTAILVVTNHSQPVTAPVAVHHHRKPPVKAPTKTKAPAKPKLPPIPKKYPTIPTSGTANGSATASFTAVTHEQLPLLAPLQVVNLPWQKRTQWAVEPLGMAMNHNSSTSPTLWFGERTGTGKWTWIPITLPGVPSGKLPAAIRESLIMAYSLHVGEPGPNNTVGNIQWQNLQGKVGSPVGWTLTTASTNASPLFQPTVGLVLFQQSYTGAFSGYYGLEAAFDAQNAATGLHGLVGFVSRTGPLSTIVKTPPGLL